MSRYLIIRHTKPDIASGLCYGHRDVPYERQGFADWSFPDHEAAFYRTYASPSSRCLDLALRHCAGPICVDERLMELHFGAWEGRLWSDIPRAESERWTDDYRREAPPGGETLNSLIRRIQSFFEKLETHQNLAFFTHAGVMRVILLAAHQEPMSEYFTRDVAYGSIWDLPRFPESKDFENLLAK